MLTLANLCMLASSLIMLVCALHVMYIMNKHSKKHKDDDK